MRPDVPESNEAWRHRRRLVYGSFVLAFAMIVWGAVTFDRDAAVSSQLVVGGVSLLSIILSAYVGFATLDDRWQRPSEFDYAEEYDGEPVDEYSEDPYPDGGRGGDGVGGWPVP